MAESGPRVVRAPRGTELSCRGWQQEAALRMLMNNLDPEVAERPDDLVVYGGTGKAARDWACFDAIVATLRRLDDDETLLVQSGKPVGVFQTHECAPRVLIANANLVRDWATWDEFRRLDALGPDHVRPDDRRLLDLHRHAGHPAGHLPDLRRRGREALRRRPGAAGSCSPPGWAAWAARSRWPSPWPAAWRSASRSTPRASSAASRRATSTSRPTSLDEALALADERGRDAAQPLSIGLLRQRRRRLPRAGAARRHPRPGHRPDLGPRHAQRLRAQRHDARGGADAAREPTLTST